MKTVSFITLGCKVNQYETSAMMQSFLEKGYVQVPFGDKADVAVVNTCTVTGESARKSRQMIRRARRANPDGLVVSCGCLSHLEGEPEGGSADIVIGNLEKPRIVEIVETCRRHHEVTNVFQQREYEGFPASGGTPRTRAFVKIQDGCDNFCAYCVIPYARGRSRSRKPEDVFREVRSLAENGAKEIVFTGIHLDSYGKDLEATSLVHILERAQQETGIHRIRLSSLEPGIIDREFIQRVRVLDKLCPHFHLSLQSGCDDTLKRMNRRYTTLQYRETAEALRKHFPGVSLTTDVIVGFPGEDDREFRESLDFVREMGFLKVHVFPFSPLEPAAAQKMPGQVPPGVKGARSVAMIKMSTEVSRGILEEAMGKKVSVLVEQEVKDQPGHVEGHTENFIRVVFPGDDKDINSFKDVTMMEIEGEHVLGRLHREGGLY
ncbi:MAG: tRNA (N(6)-L-threonylcarbamoyladenosine(37)-C(2))-methylthiotransferase MtaB [Clostridia bacterium]